MIAETLRATNLGELKVSDTVNYERSTKFGEEIGGHVVSGHVHTTARRRARGDREQSLRSGLSPRPRDCEVHFAERFRGRGRVFVDSW